MNNKVRTATTPTTYLVMIHWKNGASQPAVDCILYFDQIINNKFHSWLVGLGV